jgi:hypothetical protein
MATDELITINPAGYPPIAALIRARGEPCRNGLVRMPLSVWKPLRSMYLKSARPGRLPPVSDAEADPANDRGGCGCDPEPEMFNA